MKKTKKNKTLEKPQSQPEPLNFTHALTRVAVAQICQSVGYTSAKSSALQTLTTVAGLYLKTLTTLAATNANRLGRTESNLLDIVVALEDLGSVKGFRGGSDVTRGLLKSSVLGDVVEFIFRVDEIPFAQAIRRPEVGSFRSFEFGSEDGMKHSGNVSVAANVPMWLPRFPDPKTYKEVLVDDDKGGSFREVLFPNGRVEEVSGSGGCEGEKLGMRGGCGGELRSDLFRVKFRFGGKRRKKCGLEVEADVWGNDEVPNSDDVKEKERSWKEKEKKVYVRRGLLSMSGEKRIASGGMKCCSSFLSGSCDGSKSVDDV